MILAGLLSFAVADPANSSVSLRQKCTSIPCPNTPSGEDPELIDIREGAQIEKRMRADPDDRRRWSNIIIFADATAKHELTLPIVMKEKFSVTLAPENGALEFSSAMGTHAFRIAADAGTIGDPCPKYQIRVVEADTDYAIIRKTCPKREYKPGQFYRSNDFYLYDIKSATLRVIWAASSLAMDAPAPIAKPDIRISKLKNGYQFKWSGLFPSSNGISQMTINNIYRHESSSKGITLVCYDVRSPERPLKEGDMCEGEVMEKIRLKR